MPELNKQFGATTIRLGKQNSPYINCESCQQNYIKFDKHECPTVQPVQ